MSEAISHVEARLEHRPGYNRVAIRLHDPVPKAGDAGGLGAVCAAIEHSVVFEPVADDPAAAMRARRCENLDRAFEAVKNVLLPPWLIVNALSYSLPHNSHFAMTGLLEIGPLARVRSVWCMARELRQEFSRPMRIPLRSGFTLLPRADFGYGRASRLTFGTRLTLASAKSAPNQPNPNCGAGRGNRTLTLLPELDFESSASTNSAIPALRARGAAVGADDARARWRRHYRGNGHTRQMGRCVRCPIARPTAFPISITNCRPS